MAANLPLRSLNIFAVAARYCSFKKAAEELCVTPQAVSLQVRNLEQQLSLTLFQRLPAGLQLTAEGQQLLDYVDRGVKLIEQGIDDLQQRHQRRQLRISVSPWFAVHCLLPRLSEFEQQNPQVDLQISASVRFPDFRDQHLDLAIQWGFGHWPFSRKQLLLTDDCMLVCHRSLISDDNPLSHAEHLPRQRLLCTELSLALWQKLYDTLNVDAVVERQALILDSQASQVEAVSNGLGVALLPLAVAQQGCEEGRFVSPLGDWKLSDLNPALVPGYWLVEREGRERDPLVAEFSHWLQTWLRDDPRAIRVNISDS